MPGNVLTNNILIRKVLINLQSLIIIIIIIIILSNLSDFSTCQTFALYITVLIYKIEYQLYN